MMEIRIAAFFLVISLGYINAYAAFRSNFFDSFRPYEDGFRSKRKTSSVAEQIYYQDLLAPFFSRGHSESKRSRTVPEDAAVSGCTERSKIIYTSPTTATLDVRFPSVHTTKDDSYMCTGYRIPFEDRESFIVKFTPHADMERTHHMLVFGCDSLNSDKPYWSCSDPCRNKHTIYAWARNAPELTMPKDVGFSIGADSGIKYIAIEMHFAKSFDEGSCAGVSVQVTTQPQKYSAGIFLLGAYAINLPPHSSNVPTSAACMNPVKHPMHVFAFRTHAHTHANVITGYRLHEQEYKMIGKGNPKWPQSFYPRVGGEIVLRNGDILAAQCIYNNTGDTVVRAGATGSDEMCNLYLMFYTADKSALKTDLECWGLPRGMTEDQFHLPKSVGQMAPYPGYAGEDSIKAIADGTAVKPRVPAEHVHNHHGGGHHEEEEEEEGEEEHETPTAVDQHKQPGSDHESQSAELKNLVNETETLSRSHGMPEYQGLQADLSFPHLQAGFSIGAVGGLVAADDGSVYVFHRAGREWTAYSFDSFNRFTEPNNPIAEATVYHLSKDSGAVLHSWGKNQFFMPHGASLDPQGYLWLTDVAMHQVFKFPPNGAKEPLIALGERMVPGSDAQHFCKPTDVAIDTDGMIYVSDGYCNGRVMKFAADGTFVKQWGRMVTSIEMMHPPPPPGAFFVAHNIILCGPDLSELCVADRENGRIQCFTKDGQMTRIISDKEQTGSRIFAIAYSPLEGGLIYGVNGPSPAGEPAGGFTMHYDTGIVMKRWQPASNAPLTDPHDITASPSGKQVYIGDLTQKKIFKLYQVPSAQEEVESSYVAFTPPPLGGQPEIINKKSGTELNSAENRELLPETIENLEEIAEIPGNDDGKMIEEVREFPDGNVNSTGAATVVIICLVALPTLAILTAFICIRVRAKRLKEYQSLLSPDEKSRGKSLNLGKFLKPADRKGFTRVRSEASDEDDDESDVEVYSKKNSGNNKKPVSL